MLAERSQRKQSIAGGFHLCKTLGGANTSIESRRLAAWAGSARVGVGGRKMGCHRAQETSGGVGSGRHVDCGDGSMDGNISQDVANCGL